MREKEYGFKRSIKFDMCITRPIQFEQTCKIRYVLGVELSNGHFFHPQQHPHSRRHQWS